jgi:hypothetical protein
MDRTNYWIDILLLISFIMVSLTGFMLQYDSSNLFGFSVFSIHSKFGLIITFLVGIHLILHFNWLKVMTVGLFKKNVEENCSEKVSEQDCSIKKV